MIKMKRICFVVFVLSIALLSCKVSSEKSGAEGNDFYLGTYTQGESKGIYKFHLSADGQISALGLMASAENPSFLAFGMDKHVLLTVNEVDKNGCGTVQSFLIEEDSLKLLSVSSSGGAHPCHVSVQDGQVVVSNYSGGNLGWLSLNDEGYLSALSYASQHEGVGATDCQKVPHAHSAWFVGDEIISVDLGTDELWVYDRDRNLKQRVKMEAGSGPRHLCIHPSGQWLYVVNELNNTVTKVLKAYVGWEAAESFSTLPEDFEGTSYCADIRITNDGRFVYASNRGYNSIAIFEVGVTGELNIVGYEPVRGDHPRNFALSPDEKFLVVANKNTNNMVVFKRDAETGLLSFVSEHKAPSPVCVLFE